jgi:hypothetical protein
MTTTIVAVPHANGLPAPFVDITVSGFDPATTTMTLWRLVLGRQFRVRGMVEVSASGVVTGLDFEAPLGVPFSYRAEEFDSAGAFRAWSEPVTVTMPGPADYFWIHNPLDPATSIRLRVLYGDAATIVRPVEAEVFRMLGRSVGVALFGQRHGVERVVLDTMTESTADADRFDSLFGGYDDTGAVPIVCIRPPVAMRLPPTFYGLIVAPTHMDFNIHLKGQTARWQLVADEIAPPPAVLVSSLLDYADFTAFYSDYAAFTAAYVDYLEAQRDYSISGAA